MQIQIKHRFSHEILFEGEFESLSKAVESTVEKRVNLQGANLQGASLQRADLQGADLQGANLWGASLQGADLQGANLWGASLWGANLQGANLQRANLRGASLQGANLQGANLQGASLQGASLWGASLWGANLQDVKNIDLCIARTRILPEGDIIGYKKCMNDTIVKLKIPASAKRSHSFGRKCRAEFVEVLEVFGAETAVSNYDNKTIYRAGEIVRPDKWSDDWQNECDSGIHFFITKIEAENY